MLPGSSATWRATPATTARPAHRAQGEGPHSRIATPTRRATRGPARPTAANVPTVPRYWRYRAWRVVGASPATRMGAPARSGGTGAPRWDRTVGATSTIDTSPGRRVVGEV